MRLTEAQPSTPIQTDRTIKGLEQEVIYALLECVSETRLQVNTEAHRQLGVMVRLDQLLQNCRCGIPRVSDICTALSISERTLQSCCRQHVGVSPSRYFHLLRMRRVYNALTDAHRETDSVRQIAKCHGFKAPDRFAAAYLKQFGELPSATLRRYQGA